MLLMLKKNVFMEHPTSYEKRRKKEKKKNRKRNIVFKKKIHNINSKN